MLNPLRALRLLADRFEERGVYVPGDPSGATHPWADFGKILACWILALALIAAFFALAT